MNKIIILYQKANLHSSIERLDIGGFTETSGTTIHSALLYILSFDYLYKIMVLLLDHIHFIHHLMFQIKYYLFY